MKRILTGLILSIALVVLVAPGVSQADSINLKVQSSTVCGGYVDLSWNNLVDLPSLNNGPLYYIYENGQLINGYYAGPSKQATYTLSLNGQSSATFQVVHLASKISSQIVTVTKSSAICTASSVTSQGSVPVISNKYMLLDSTNIPVFFTPGSSGFANFNFTVAGQNLGNTTQAYLVPVSSNNNQKINLQFSSLNPLVTYPYSAEANIDKYTYIQNVTFPSSSVIPPVGTYYLYVANLAGVSNPITIDVSSSNAGAHYAPVTSTVSNSSQVVTPASTSVVVTPVTSTNSTTNTTQTTTVGIATSTAPVANTTSIIASLQAQLLSLTNQLTALLAQRSGIATTTAPVTNIPVITTPTTTQVPVSNPAVTNTTNQNTSTITYATNANSLVQSCKIVGSGSSQTYEVTMSPSYNASNKMFAWLNWNYVSNNYDMYAGYSKDYYGGPIGSTSKVYAAIYSGGIDYSNSVLCPSASSNTISTTNNTSTTQTTSTVVPQNYILSYSANSGGYLSGNSSQTVVKGSNGTAVTAIANSGYRFTVWSDGLTTATRTDSNVQTSKSLVANFTVNTTVTNTTSTTNQNTTNTQTVTPTPVVVAPTVPSTPSNFYDGPGSCGGNININWNTVSGATSYKLYRSGPGSSASFSLLASGLTSGSYSDNSLQTGSTYYYKVSAVNSVGESTQSSQIWTISSSACAVAPVVTTPTLSSIYLSPMRTLLTQVGSTDVFTATGQDKDGNNLSVPITWTSSNPAVATVGPAKIQGDSSLVTVTAVSSGTANIIASSGGISNTAVVTVTLSPTSYAPSTQTASVYDALKILLDQISQTLNLLK